MPGVTRQEVPSGRGEPGRGLIADNRAVHRHHDAKQAAPPVVIETNAFEGILSPLLYPRRRASLVQLVNPLFYANLLGETPEEKLIDSERVRAVWADFKMGNCLGGAGGTGH